MAHLDVEAFREHLSLALGIEAEAGPKPDVEADPRNRGAVADLARESHPTLYGVMAFGRVPQGYPQTRGFRVRCVAYDGCDRDSAVLCEGDAAGRLRDQVGRAVAWLSGLGRTAARLGPVREGRPLLPLAAVREALVNAVVHRDYAIIGSEVALEVFADRVEVTSPGGLRGRMGVENIRAGGFVRTRNELMANYMLAQGLGTRRGRGWQLMRRAMRQFNGTEPAIALGGPGPSLRVRFILDAAR